MFINFTLSLSFFALPLAFFLGLKVVFITAASSVKEALAFSSLLVVEESRNRASARAYRFGQITNGRIF